MMEKIEQLLNSQTSANNSLAIELMVGTLQYSFVTAFSKLHLCKQKWGGHYVIEINNIIIEYRHDHHPMIDYIYIHRKIYHLNNLLADWSTEIYSADPWQHQGINKGLNQEEQQAIEEDRKKISPFIQQLFYHNDRTKD